MSETIILDKPHQIEAFRLIATLRGLELELKTMELGWPPTACPTRGMALASGRRILKQYGRSAPRTRKAVRAGMHMLCLEMRLLEDQSDS